MNDAPLYPSVKALIAELGYLKVCVCWVAGMLRDAYEKTRKAIATDVLCHCNTRGEGFLLLIVTVGFKTCVPHFEFGSKQ
jgi:hypothetical protein